MTKKILFAALTALALSSFATLGAKAGDVTLNSTTYGSNVNVTGTVALRDFSGGYGNTAAISGSGAVGGVRHENTANNEALAGQLYVDFSDVDVTSKLDASNVNVAGTITGRDFDSGMNNAAVISGTGSSATYTTTNTATNGALAIQVGGF